MGTIDPAKDHNAQPSNRGSNDIRRDPSRVGRRHLQDLAELNITELRDRCP
ncbi:hypothetical protein GCM10017581_089790 [Dactylosporangium matsuzakiense]|uniref:Uncharacterized protein n=1 Tax=Dactylosporangium matsuzakiense TaxID=53360 RepID=A0A9W6NSK0_9ACTN|nr:hypothetical protein GCM10017581_089790 [Dactylosporangium matsuzakiense]